MDDASYATAATIEVGTLVEYEQHDRFTERTTAHLGIVVEVDEESGTARVAPFEPVGERVPLDELTPLASA